MIKTIYDVRVEGKTYRSFKTREEAVTSRNQFNAITQGIAFAGRAYISVEYR